jgi:hypothetical protein
MRSDNTNSARPPFWRKAWAMFGSRSRVITVSRRQLQKHNG